MVRDLDREDHVRSLKQQQASLAAFRANPSYRLLTERIDDEIGSRARLAVDHRQSVDSVRVLQGEVKAYRHVLVLLEREQARVERQLAEAV